MSKSSKRVNPLFSTHRGRAIRNVGAVVLLIGFVMFFWNGATAESTDPDTQSSELYSFSNEESSNPDVAAPLARPFAAPMDGEIAAASSDGDGMDVGGSDTPSAEPTSYDSGDGGYGDESDASGDDDSPSQEDMQRMDTYQSAVLLTGKVAEAYATYDPAVTSPQAWGDSLPGIEPELRDQLVVSADGLWPTLLDREASSDATLKAQSVTPMAYRADGSLLMSVTVNVTEVWEGSQSKSSKSFTVALRPDSSAEDQWVVTDIQ